MSNLQTLFDKAVGGVLAQGKGSVRRTKGPMKLECAYRAEGGLKCAVGHLIADEHYKPMFEGGGIKADGPVREAVELSCGFKLRHEDLELMTWLQLLHDSHAFSGEVNFKQKFLEGANVIAAKMNLAPYREEASCDLP